MGQNAPIPGNAGNNNQNGSNANNALISNNFQARQELKFQIVADASGPYANVLFCPGPVPSWVASKFGTQVCDQNHLTLTSSVSASGHLAEFNAYLAALGMHVVYMRLTTSDTTLYNGSLFLGEMPVNGIAAPAELVLSDYATVIGGGGTYDRTLKITDYKFANTGNFFAYFSSIPASCTVQIALGVDYTSNVLAAKSTGSN